MKIQLCDRAFGSGIRSVIFQKENFVAIGAALAAAAISPASAKPPISATDLFGIAYAMNPVISPDGQAVAYLREWMDPKADTYRSQLWLSDFAGKAQRAAAHLILVSLNSTCLRATGSYFLNDSLSVFVREFFFVT